MNPAHSRKRRRGVLSPAQLSAIDRVHALLDELERERRSRENRQRAYAARKEVG